MAEWRFLRGWSEKELAERLRLLPSLARNFKADDEAMTTDKGWRRQFSEALIVTERSGSQDKEEIFTRLCVALRNYEFSDPRIVVAHFYPDHPLQDRRMLLEMRVLGLRYLAATVISDVRDEQGENIEVFGFRYETLHGHIEAGWEWFLLRKNRSNGEIRFSIEARWREGEFPNFWSRWGFRLLGRRMQKRWHQQAHKRLALLSRYPLEQLRRRGRGLAHEGPEIRYEFD